MCDDVFIHHFGSVSFKANALDHRAHMERNWHAFCEKWGLPDAPMATPYDARGLARPGFERDAHFVPCRRALDARGDRVTPRFHARFPGALCEGLAALGRDARLAAYRIEPVRTVDGPQHYLDLTFADGEHVGVVAGIRIDRHALAHRDRSPFVAPRDAHAVVEQLDAAYDAIVPAVLATFTACAEPEATLYVCDDAPDAAITARVDAHALGAAPYACVARARGSCGGRRRVRGDVLRRRRPARARSGRSRVRRTPARRCAATSRCRMPRSPRAMPRTGPRSPSVRRSAATMSR